MEVRIIKKTIQEIAQWVIDNRYPKSENDKVSDAEMYHTLIEAMNQVLLQPPVISSAVTDVYMDDADKRIIVVICRFLDELQDKYSLNDFCPADITLSKNGDMLFAKVKDTNDGEIILNRWQLDEFKNSKIY